MTRRIVLALCVLLLPSWLLAQRYTTVDAPNSVWTEGTGISPNANFLTGDFFSSPGIRGFLFHNGSFQIVAHPATGAPLLTNLTDVNDWGLAVGFYADFVIPVVPPVHGFFFRNGNFTAIDFPDPTIDTYPMSINNFGQVVGNIQDSRCDGPAFACRRKGFLLSRGQYSALEFPGAVATFATGINNRGVIVGNYQNVDGPAKGFVLARRQYRSMTCPGMDSMGLFGINDSGDMVATCGSSSLLLTKHRSHTIAFPGATGTRVRGVGNRFHGKVPVVGSYSDGSGVEHGFYALIPLDRGDENDN